MKRDLRSDYRAGVTEIMTDFLKRYPGLAVCREPLLAAFEMLKAAFADGKMLLICGNGGSAADAEHISGELMKGFLKKRPLSETDRLKLQAAIPENIDLADLLQEALPAYPLSVNGGLTTAIINDLRADLIFAQQVWGYGSPGDVLLAISTSGNSPNVLNAVYVAKAKGLKTIALTGAAGGKLKQAAEVTIMAPASETYQAQEEHLPLYHCLCAMVEEEFFGSERRYRLKGAFLKTV